MEIVIDSTVCDDSDPTPRGRGVLTLTLAFTRADGIRVRASLDVGVTASEISRGVSCLFAALGLGEGPLSNGGPPEVPPPPMTGGSPVAVAAERAPRTGKELWRWARDHGPGTDALLRLGQAWGLPGFVARWDRADVEAAHRELRLSKESGKWAAHYTPEIGHGR